MKSIEKRIQALEEKAGIAEKRSMPPIGDLDKCFEAFDEMLRAYGQHDKQARQHFLDSDGGVRFRWASSQTKWNAFYYAWDMQRRKYERL
jgi:hypothetical protein